MRDKREKNWFWLDNALVDRKDLNIYEKMLYVCLAKHVGSNGYAFPGLDTLCEELGIKDTRTIVKHTKTLVEKGLVTVIKLKGKSNRYYLYNVEKVPTLNVPTLDAKDLSEKTKVSTSDVGTSSNIECRSKKTNIKKETTKLDILDKIEANPKTAAEGSSSFSENSEKERIKQIKTALQSHGLSIGTCKNIMELVYSKHIDLDRIKKVLTVAPLKKWEEGAIYKALKDNWDVNIKTSKAESFTSKENLTLANNFEAEKEKNKIIDSNALLEKYFNTLEKKEKDEIEQQALKIAIEKFGNLSGPVLARTVFKYELIKSHMEK